MATSDLQGLQGEQIAQKKQRADRNPVGFSFGENENNPKRGLTILYHRTDLKSTPAKHQIFYSHPCNFYQEEPGGARIFYRDSCNFLELGSFPQPRCGDFLHCDL
jgi:hypothetical protein